MGIPAVLVDEKGKPITRPVSDAEILAHLDRHSKAVMRPLYQTAEFCAACHKAAIPKHPRRLQVAARHLALRRVAGAQLHQAVSAPLLSQRRRSPPARPATCSASPCPPGQPSPAPRTASSSPIAGWAATRSSPSTTTTTSRLKSSPPSCKNGAQGKASSTSTSSPLEKSRRRRHTKGSGARRAARPHQLLARRRRTLTADVVIQNKGIGHSHVPSSATSTSPGSPSPSRTMQGKTIAESGFIQPDG
jgi:hypothetical protein